MTWLLPWAGDDVVAPHCLKYRREVIGWPRVRKPAYGIDFFRVSRGKLFPAACQNSRSERSMVHRYFLSDLTKRAGSYAGPVERSVCGKYFNLRERLFIRDRGYLVPIRHYGGRVGGD